MTRIEDQKSYLNYNPRSQVLFITIDCHTKKLGGGPEYNDNLSISPLLSEENKKYLLQTREKVRTLLLSGKVEFDGLPLSQHPFNLNLVRGKEFGGNDPRAQYLLSTERYTGRFFLAMGDVGFKKLVHSGHHLLYVSGLFGLSTPFEPVQLYSCPVVKDSNIQKLWRSDNGLTRVMEEYIKKFNIKRIFDFTARYEWRDEIDWNAVMEHTGVKILHGVCSMGNEEDALIPYGMLIRDQLLDMSEKELLAITPDKQMGLVSFRTVSKKKVGDPDLTLDEWSRTLPFPLASILWLYLAQPKNNEKAVDHLLHFFEAFAIFQSTVLLSGFSNNELLFNNIREKYPREITSLDPHKLITFGNWVHINRILAKEGQKMLSGSPDEKQQIRDLFKTQNSQILNMLFSEEITKILFQAFEIRNKTAHSGYHNEEMIQEKLETLRGLLTELKYCISTYWENYLLLLPGEMRYREGMYLHKARLLMHTSYPFREIDVDLVEAMDSDHLYLFDRNEKKALKLLPLIKFYSHPQLACYFYNKTDGKSVNLVSYHYEDKPDMTMMVPEIYDALQKLSSK